MADNVRFPWIFGITFTETYWRIIILLLTAIVLIATIWCLSSGITTVFMHLYYFPIVLMAYHYRWRGFLMSVLLAAAYFFLVGIFTPPTQTEIITSAFYRSLVFCGVAAIIAWLSESLEVAHDSLRLARQFQENVITNANIWITVLAEDGMVLIWNDAAEAISGYLRSEVLGRNTVWKMMYPEKEYRRQVTGEIQRIIRINSILENFETRIRCADGTEKTIVWNTRSLENVPGTTTRYIAIGRDVSAQKAAVQKLQESEEKYRTLIEKANEAVIITQDGNFVFVNPSMSRILGVPENDLLGRPFEQFIWPEDRNLVLTRHKQRTAGLDVPDKYDFRIFGEGGKMRWVSITSSRILWKDRPATLNLLTDISERKKIEEALRESESFNRGLVENLPDYLAVYGQNGEILYVNPASASALGYDADSLTGMPVLSFVADEYRDLVVAKLAARRAEDSPGPYEIELVTKNRIRKSVIVKAAPIQYRNMPATLLLLTDITERKRIEEEIRYREEQFRAIFNTQQTGLLIVDAQSHVITDANESALSMIGASREQVVGNVCHAFICPADAGRCPITDLGQTVDNSERVLIRADGSHIPVLKSVKSLSIKGQRYLIESFIDLSERKQMEEQIRQSWQLFADIISFLPDPTLVVDRSGNVIAWNKALERLSGVKAADIIGRGNHEYSTWLYGKRRPILLDLALNPDKDVTRMLYNNIHNDGSTVMAETEAVLASGKKVVLSLVASPLVDDKGTITGAIESMRDITWIKEAETELARLNATLEERVKMRTQALNDEVAHRKEAERMAQLALEYTRSVIEANPDLMVVLDTTGKILDINSAGEKLTGIPVNQLIGQTYFRYLEDDGTLQSAFARLLDEGKIENFVRIRRTDGHLTPLSVHATVIRGSGKSDDHILVSAHDITRQKRDEEAIRASLEEKVILLREIHHRVKNNLQIIISLTNLQMRQADDPGVRLIMAETQNRVRAMSLVHEKLYRSESLSQIDFPEYTRYLATQLFAFYSMDASRVHMEISMTRIMVDINTAVPMGLIMNELISNALKHAFPGGRRGTISIRGGEENGIITISVRDNGIGLPPDLDWQNTESLGLRLVTSLVDQVGGTITLDTTGGTGFFITVVRQVKI